MNPNTDTSNSDTINEESKDPNVEEFSEDEDSELELSEESISLSNSSRLPSLEDCDLNDRFSPILKKRKQRKSDQSLPPPMRGGLLFPPDNFRDASSIPNYPSLSLLVDPLDDTVPFFTEDRDFISFDDEISVDPLENSIPDNNWNLDYYDPYRHEQNTVCNCWWMPQDH